MRPGKPYPATFHVFIVDFQWSTGESNPDLLYAKQMSSRWTSTPFHFLLQHAPKDSNPDILGWNQQCYRYTKDVHLSIFRFRLFGPNFIRNTKLQWERKELHLSPTTTQLTAGGLQPPVWKRSPTVKNNPQVFTFKTLKRLAEAVGLEPTTVLPAAVFKTASSSGRITSVIKLNHKFRLRTKRKKARCSCDTEPS